MNKLMTKFFNILVTFAIVLSLAWSPNGNSFAAASVSQNTTTGLFRTRVVLPDANALTRLSKLGIRILETGKSDALVLATSDQLASLVKLRFEPANTDDLGSLVGANAASSPWLELSLRPALAQAASLSSQIKQAQNQAATSQAATASPDMQTANTALQGILAGLTLDQTNAITGLTAVDDDADGLTNTQEQWWCTDSLNPYSREDPNKTGTGTHKDGDYVSRLLQYLYHPELGDNRLGAPFAGWPMVPGDGHFNANCLDADHDGVPDLAEMYVIGSNPNAESTAHDRYDDGQKLFNLTPPNWGVLPRAADGAYASLNLPGYVQWPGRSLFAAAIAQPKVSVVDSSLHVAAVTTITTDHTITSGTEKSYSTAKTSGVSKSESDTTTWNNWEETATTTPTYSNVLNPQFDSPQAPSIIPIIAVIGTVLTVAEDIKKGCETADYFFGAKACQRGAKAVSSKVSAVASDVAKNGAKYISEAYQTVKTKAVDIYDKGKDWVDKNLQLNSCTVGIPPQISCEIGFKNNNSSGIPNPADKSSMSGNTNDLIGGLSGNQMQPMAGGQLGILSSYPMQYPNNYFVPTTTQSNGNSWGGAHSVTNTQYEENTVTNGEAFSNSDAWGTATAVDSAHAADLWFTYTVSNVGTDYAGEIANLTFNVYIGNDPNPVYTYFAAPEIGGDGKLHNFMPSDAPLTFTSHHIPLNLDQMKAIDLGQPLRIVLEDYSYGADEQFYQDAATSDLKIAIDDGPNDGDQTLDNYILPTWGGNETVLDVLARYFPHTVDENNALTAIWTPEYRSDTPAWCIEPRVVTAGGQRSLWCKHALSTADWWNIYTSGMGDGSQGLQDSLALPNSVALFRFNQDSDLDGYSDTTEIQLGTDPHDAASFPHPELLAGVNNIKTGTNVVSTLSLLNTGLYDAYGVEAVMVAPDDSITITNNTVGGSGRVKALKQVVVGSSIQAPSYTTGSWTGAAKPAAGGYYTGTVNHTYTFTVICAAPGGCDVSSGTWSLGWADDLGAVGSLNFGGGYKSPNLLAAGALGVKVSLLSGKVYNGNTFTVVASTPSDTFQYTINRTPYTAPVVVVSYNDPQGNHRFIISPAAMSLANPTDNLAGFSGKMLQDPGVQLVTSAPFTAGANTTNLVVNNPSGVTLTDSKLFLEFIDPTGNVVREESLTQTLPAGPSVVPVSWDTSTFSPAYDPAQDYIVMAFWTDYQGNIIATGGRPLSSFQTDPKPAFAMADSDAAWNFGSASQGTLLKRSFTFANTGQMDLLTYVDAPAGMSVSQTGSRDVSPADFTTYDISLNTSNLPLGAYDQTVTIHTSDPANPTKIVHVTGTITVGTSDVAPGSVIRPLDYTLNIPDSHNQGEWYEFTHDLGPDPQSLQPVKVYSQDYSTLWGVGKYATDFGGTGTASYDMFGDGRDGTMPASGNLDYTNGFGVGSVNGTAGSTSIYIEDRYAVWRINPGDYVLLHQTRGSGAGNWELNKAVSDVTGTGTFTLSNPLAFSYITNDGNERAQIMRVPQYTDCQVTGIVTPLMSWNGNVGGIFAVMCSGTASISGAIINGGGNGATGTNGNPAGGQGGGYWGGEADHVNNDCQGGGQTGEGNVGPLMRNHTPNGNGGASGDFNDCNGSTGGGGGNGTPGGNGNRGNLHIGEGGYTAGNPELTAMVFGGGGGGSAHEQGRSGGGGGSGGGITIVLANILTVSDGVTANGGNGGGNDVGGGGGAGGSILLRGKTVNLGSGRVVAVGGAAGNNGGYGGDGRIRIEYCETLSGTTIPVASTLKLNCYISEQVEVPPYTTTRIDLPESFSNGQAYQIQYGRKVDFTSAGIQTTTLRVPAGLFATATLDSLVSGVGSGTLNLSLDIGNHGAWDWTSSSTVSGSATLNSPDLSAAFNAYWTSHGASSTGTIDVPIRVSMDQPGQLLLTNLQVTPGGSKLHSLRLPANTYASVLLNYTLSGDSGPVSVAVDVGDDGSIDDTWSGSPSSYLYTRNTGNLATAINTYLAGKTGDVDIPIRFYVAPDHILALNSFSTTFAVQPDAALTAPDIHLPATPPVEGDTVPVSATIHNPTTQDTGPLTASFFATAPGWGDWYIGSTLISNVAAGGTTVASISWDTLGFTGNVPIKVILDPYKHLAEIHEDNNQASATLTILTRPDLVTPVDQLVFSDLEPVTDEAITVSLPVQNKGQTTAGASTLSLYNGNPASSGVLIGAGAVPVISGGGSSTVNFSWIPSTAGPHRLFALVDSGSVINEGNESNNLMWKDIYVGLRGPILMDSGTTSGDPAYTPALGYGVIDQDPPDQLGNCGADDYQTYRKDLNGKVLYQFDHLLPGHFYHLDVTLYNCPLQPQRLENVLVDGTQIAGPVDLGDGQVHRLSIRLDPAVYADHQVLVSIEAPGSIYGAVVSAVNLYDIDYRYADSGGSQDPQYPGTRGYGWLDGSGTSVWGGLPYQTARLESNSNKLRYQFDNLVSGKNYNLHLTIWQGSGTTRPAQKVQIDGFDTGSTFYLDTGVQKDLTIPIPAAYYLDDGTITVTVFRLDSIGPFVNEIALEEETLPSSDPCALIQGTPLSTQAFGTVKISGVSAPAGTLVEALDSRGDVVGCSVVSTEGIYSFMPIYGEDTSVNPVIPGMRSNEPVLFRINGAPAYATPNLVWQNDHNPHTANLEIDPLDSQLVLFKAGWNLVSFNLEAPWKPVPIILQSVSGRYDKVLGENGIFSPLIPPEFNTLQQIVTSSGYYIHLTGSTTATALIEGKGISCDTPISLHVGWNWIGGPAQNYPIATALQSLAGKYKRVLSLDKVYDPALPDFSTLQQLSPGEGYLIYMSQAATLVYPCVVELAVVQAETTSSACNQVTPTPDQSIIYGIIKINGAPAPVGTVVKAVTPGGEVAGCFVVEQPGQLSLTQIYGAYPDTSPGFLPEEPVTFTINGSAAIAVPSLKWVGDKDVHQITLSSTKNQIYMPLINR